MKTTMKKLAAVLLVLILAVQVMPMTAVAEGSNILGPVEEQNFRDQLEVTSPQSILMVNDTVQLSATAKYTLKWTSSDEKVATVDETTGLVTAVGPGRVRITATEGQYRDSIILQVREQENIDTSTGTIVITGAKEKITYDGQAHTVTYTATSSMDGFDASKVVLKNEAKKVTGVDCGVYQTKFEPEDFEYTGEGNATFIISDGWIQIRPATVTVRANSVSVLENRENEARLSATVEDLPEGTDASVIHYDLRISNIGGADVVEPYGEQAQGNFKVRYISAPAEKIAEHDLYNIAEINGKYYRLKKTTIWSNKPITTANAGVGKTKENEYTVEPYDFAKLTITISGVDYLYKCNANAEAIVRGANYYEVASTTISIVMNKIGAMDGNNPRWLIPDNGSDRYNDPNNTSGFHRDYKITLHANENKAEDQTAYAMLSVNGSMDYYKLKSMTITAKPLDTYKNGKIKEGEYYVKPYDFTNVVVTIDGEEYRYSPVELTGEYTNYYTVSFENVEKSERFNKNANWFAKSESWLDGAKEEYGTLPNTTISFHVNYKATTHKGTGKPRKVTIASDWPKGKPAYTGAQITLTATLEGFTDKVELQWQRSLDRNTWENIPDAHGITYTYTLDDNTAQYSWRVVAEE